MFQIILIFGICGALRCDEAKNMKVDDVEDLGDWLLISVRENINDFPGQFMIGNLFYSKVKAYMDLKPPDQFSDRFLINYQKGKCTRQPIGRYKIDEVASEIASLLGFERCQEVYGSLFPEDCCNSSFRIGSKYSVDKAIGEMELGHDCSRLH